MKSSVYDWLKDGFTTIPNILFDQFNQLELSGDEMILLIYMMSLIEREIPVKDMNQIAQHLGWTSHKVAECFSVLTNKEYLQIELVPNSEGKQEDHYTLRPLFNKLDEIHFQQINNSEEVSFNLGLDMVPMFEEEFGRQLTQLELETLQDWLYKSNYDPDLIKLALKQAVLQQALSLKYIDRILLNWEKKNIRTVYEAENEIARFENRHASSNPSQQNNDQPSAYDHLQIPINYWDNIE